MYLLLIGAFARPDVSFRSSRRPPFRLSCCPKHFTRDADNPITTFHAFPRASLPALIPQISL